LRLEVGLGRQRGALLRFLGLQVACDGRDIGIANVGNLLRPMVPCGF
jgi:hypothetical protein